MDYRSSDLDNYITGHYGEDQFVHKHKGKGRIKMSKSKNRDPQSVLDNALGTDTGSEPQGNGKAAKKQSAAIADIPSGVKGIQLTLREDGTVTMRMGIFGLAPKVMTMYPLQWEALAKAMPQLSGKFSEPGNPIATAQPQ